MADSFRKAARQARRVGVRAQVAAVSGIVEPLESRTLFAGGTASIAGSVFFDRDADGVRDGSERAMAGVRVYLDADNDGAFDSTEQSVLSDAGGNWKFTDLAAGSYVLRAVQQSGFTRTTPTTGSFSFSLTSGQTKTGLLFGQRRTA